MTPWSLPKARPISCNDCPNFQRLHISVLCIAESFTRLPCVINTTFSEKIYSRWCCIDRLSWRVLSECGLLPAFPHLLKVNRRHDDAHGWGRSRLCPRSIGFSPTRFDCFYFHRFGLLLVRGDVARL